MTKWKIASILAVLCAAWVSSAASMAGLDDEPETIAIVPLHGQVGFVLGEREDAEHSLDSRSLDQLLRLGARADAQTVVLWIDSHGGYLGERDQIADLLDQYRREGIEFVAYVEHALGAATTIALSCKQIYVAPTATIGAASVDREHRWHREHAGLDELDAAEAARIRSVLEHAGLAPELAEAFAIRNTTLWWHPNTGYSRTRDSLDAIRLTDENRVLAMTATQMLDLGIAQGSADTPQEVAERLSESADDIQLKDLSRQAEDIGQKRRRFARDVERSYLDCLDDLKEMKRLVDELDDIYDRLENLDSEIRRASSFQERERLKKSKKEIGREKTGMDRDIERCKKTLQQIARRLRGIERNKKAVVRLDKLALCRLRHLEDALRTTWRSLKTSDDTREAQRDTESLIEAWSDCVEEAEFRLSRVRK